MKNSFAKRLMALVLVTVMCAGLVPDSAVFRIGYAADDEEIEIIAAELGKDERENSSSGEGLVEALRIP